MYRSSAQQPFYLFIYMNEINKIDVAPLIYIVMMISIFLLAI